MTIKTDKNNPYIKGITQAIGSLVKWQEQMQKVMVVTVPEAWDGDQYAMDAVKFLFEKLQSYDKRFLMEQRELGLYLTEVAGIPVDKNGLPSFPKHDKEFQRKSLDKMKETPWYKYRNNLLKAPAIPKSVETTLAKGLASGTITLDEIQSWASGLADRADGLKEDTKVLKWVSTFRKQQEELRAA